MRSRWRHGQHVTSPLLVGRNMKELRGVAAGAQRVFVRCVPAKRQSVVDRLVADERARIPLHVRLALVGGEGVS